jgi:ribosome-binding factor A
MSRVRYQRVRELLKRELGEILRRHLPIEEAGLVCVNDVGLAGDLKSAKVFVSVVGTPEQQQHAAQLIRRQTPTYQHCLAQTVVLRHTPHLQFIVDDSIARGDRVLKLLEEFEQDPPPPPSTP